MNYRTNNALVQTFGVNTLNELSTITRSGTLTVAGTTTSDQRDGQLDERDALQRQFVPNDGPIGTFLKASICIIAPPSAAVVSMQDRRDGKSIVFVVRQAHIPLRHACA